jgi:hypothetical protein
MPAHDPFLPFDAALRVQCYEAPLPLQQARLAMPQKWCNPPRVIQDKLTWINSESRVLASV